MIILEYYDGDEWVQVGPPWHNEWIAWLSLHGDDDNYRTVDSNGKVLTDKSINKQTT